jgi:hypothetical protein
MAELLAAADLAQSQNGHLDANGQWHHYFADLASPQCREWVLRPDRNVISLTGTAHTVTAYRRLPHGWRTTPPGRWADHYMWQQFLVEPWVRAVTGTRVTALQFPSHLDARDGWSPQERRAELEVWRISLGGEHGRARLEETVRRAMATQATATHLRRDELEEAIVASEEGRARSAAEAASLAKSLRAAGEGLAAIEATRTWRLRSSLRRIAPLRALARATARHQSP